MNHESREYLLLLKFHLRIIMLGMVDRKIIMLEMVDRKIIMLGMVDRKIY